MLRDGLADPRVTEIRGRGLFVGLDLDAELAPRVAEVAQRHGIILNACAPNRIRIVPPLVLTAEQAGELLDLWPRILDEAYADEQPGDSP